MILKGILDVSITSLFVMPDPVRASHPLVEVLFSAMVNMSGELPANRITKSSSNFSPTVMLYYFRALEHITFTVNEVSMS